MAGRNHHRIGLGSHSLTAMGFPGYNAIPAGVGASRWPSTCRRRASSNYAIGKWDHTPLYEVSESGPFDRWPSGEGFDHYYGFMAADADQFRSVMCDDHRPIEPGSPRERTTTTRATWPTRRSTTSPVTCPRHPRTAPSWCSGARRDALASPSAQGVPSQVAGQVRHGLGQGPRG